MARHSKALGASYASAAAYYERLTPATNRQRTVPGSRQMRGEASHRRVRLNANTGDVECFLKGTMLAAYHPDNSVTIYRGDMTQTDAQHHRRVLPPGVFSDVGFVGGAFVGLHASSERNKWREAHMYLVPAAGLRVVFPTEGTAALHPDSATQPIRVWKVDQKRSAEKRKEHGIDDFIAWATAAGALKPELMAVPDAWNRRWAVPVVRQERASDVLRDLADQSRWMAFCEHYTHRAIETARQAVIDMYDCWTFTEVPYLVGGWTAIKSWRAQCLEATRSEHRAK